MAGEFMLNPRYNSVYIYMYIYMYDAALPVSPHPPPIWGMALQVQGWGWSPVAGGIQESIDMYELI